MPDYFIKGYKGKFSIYCRDEAGKSKCLETLSTTNSDEQTVRMLLKGKIKKLREEDRANGGADTFTDANLNRVLKYYEQEVRGRVRTKDQSKRSRLNALKRSIAAIGSLDLQAATLKELAAEIARLPNSEHRIVGMNLNVLLKWLGRGFSLELKEPLTPTPLSITEEDFKLVAWPEPYKHLFHLAFYSGMRVGELFGRWELVDKDSVRITHQLLINEKTRHVYYGPLKNKLPHRFVYLWPEGLEAARAISNWSEDKKQELRVLPWSRICRKSTGGVLTFHDLRHSYAFLSRVRGMSTSDLASSLGNSLSVVERYYAGKGDTPAHILSIRNSIHK